MKTKVDKYKLYEASVQEPEADIVFINNTFEALSKREARTLREDFSGTSLISLEWVQQGPRHEAYAVDLDPEPIEYSRKHHLPKLAPKDRERMHYLRRDVKKLRKPLVDIVAAFNFSYWVFKEREELLTYFRSVRRSLKSDGLFFLDLFGGSEAQLEVTESKNVGSFRYLWECRSFNPINNDIEFSIHFKLRNGKMLKHAFRYDWRLWTLPELRDLIHDADFSTSLVYWEGDDGKGGGNGIFKPESVVENSESWIAYLVAIP